MNHRESRIEDKRTQERAKEKGLPKGTKRQAEGRLLDRQVVTHWKQALAQLAIANPAIQSLDGEGYVSKAPPIRSMASR
jgi:hypothetical protein